VADDEDQLDALVHVLVGCMCLCDYRGALGNIGRYPVRQELGSRAWCVFGPTAEEIMKVSLVATIVEVRP